MPARPWIYAKICGSQAESDEAGSNCQVRLMNACAIWGAKGWCHVIHFCPRKLIYGLVASSFLSHTFNRILTVERVQ